MLKLGVKRLIYREWEYQSWVIENFSKKGLVLTSEKYETLYLRTCELQVALSDFRIALLHEIKDNNIAIVFCSPVLGWMMVMDFIYRY